MQPLVRLLHYTGKMALSKLADAILHLDMLPSDPYDLCEEDCIGECLCNEGEDERLALEYAETLHPSIAKRIVETSDQMEALENEERYDEISEIIEAFNAEFEAFVPPPPPPPRANAIIAGTWSDIVDGMSGYLYRIVDVELADGRFIQGMVHSKSSIIATIEPVIGTPCHVGMNGAGSCTIFTFVVEDGGLRRTTPYAVKQARADAARETKRKARKVREALEAAYDAFPAPVITPRKMVQSANDVMPAPVKPQDEARLARAAAFAATPRGRRALAQMARLG